MKYKIGSRSYTAKVYMFHLARQNKGNVQSRVWCVTEQKPGAAAIQSEVGGRNKARGSSYHPIRNQKQEKRKWQQLSSNKEPEAGKRHMAQLTSNKEPEAGIRDIGNHLIRNQKQEQGTWQQERHDTDKTETSHPISSNQKLAVETRHVAEDNHPIRNQRWNLAHGSKQSFNQKLEMGTWQQAARHAQTSSSWNRF